MIAIALLFEIMFRVTTYGDKARGEVRYYQMVEVGAINPPSAESLSRLYIAEFNQLLSTQIIIHNGKSTQKDTRGPQSAN